MINNIRYILESFFPEIQFKNETNTNNRNYLALPDYKKSKFLFSLDSCRKGFNNGLNLYPTITLKHKVKKYAVKIFRIIVPVLPDKYFISFDTDNFSGIIYKRLSTNVENYNKVHSCNIKAGSAGKGNKLIFQFLDVNGNIISYIKAGDPNFRSHWINNELNILKYITNKSKDIIDVPKIIGFFKSNTFTSLEISPLNNFKYGSLSFNMLLDVFLNLHNKTTGELIINFDEENLKIKKLIIDVKTADFIIDHIISLVNSKIPGSLSHRDLPAWNILSDNKDNIAILDWEFARFNHNPLQDIFHYFIHTKINTSNKKSETVLMQFLNNINLEKKIINFSKNIGINRPSDIFSLFVYYLWDWYSLEQHNSENENQGIDYLIMLNYLAKNANSNKFFI